MKTMTGLKTLFAAVIALALCLPSAAALAQPHDHHDHHDQHDQHDPGHPSPVTDDGHDHDHGPVSGQERLSIDDASEADLRSGAMIYRMACIACHGTQGRGDGGAAIFLGPYSHPRPNDFKTGTIKFRSTRSGQPPLLTDLMRTIRDGIPGFMPAYRNLGEDGIFQVAAYVTHAFIETPLAESSDIDLPDYPGPAAMTPASIRDGRQLYSELGCADCHGRDGRGADVHLLDKRGLMIMPMDLARPGMFGGGRKPEDLYRTLMTGLDGTPMPGYAGVFENRQAALWDLVHFILSLEDR